MKKYLLASSLTFMCFYLLFPQAANATCLSQCKAEHSSFVDEKSNKTDARAYLTHLCSTRCKTNNCNAKSVSEYLSEYKPYKMPSCVKEDLETTDFDALRANSARREAETKKNVDEAKAIMRDLQRQPAPQSSTLTTQNSSVHQVQIDESSGGVNHCIEVFFNDKGYPRFRNTCSFTIKVAWCVVGVDCGGPNGRLERLRPGSIVHTMSEPTQEVKYGACEESFTVDSSAGNGSFVCRR